MADRDISINLRESVPDPEWIPITLAECREKESVPARGKDARWKRLDAALDRLHVIDWPNGWDRYWHCRFAGLILPTYGEAKDLARRVTDFRTGYNDSPLAKADATLPPCLNGRVGMFRDPSHAAIISDEAFIGDLADWSRADQFFYRLREFRSSLFIFDAVPALPTPGVNDEWQCFLGSIWAKWEPGVLLTCLLVYISIHSRRGDLESFIELYKGLWRKIYSFAPAYDLLMHERRFCPLRYHAKSPDDPYGAVFDDSEWLSVLSIESRVNAPAQSTNLRPFSKTLSYVGAYPICRPGTAALQNKSLVHSKGIVEFVLLFSVTRIYEMSLRLGRDSPRLQAIFDQMATINPRRFVPEYDSRAVECLAPPCIKSFFGAVDREVASGPAFMNKYTYSSLMRTIDVSVALLMGLGWSTLDIDTYILQAARLSKLSYAKKYAALREAQRKFSVTKRSLTCSSFALAGHCPYAGAAEVNLGEESKKKPRVELDSERSGNGNQCACDLGKAEQIDVEDIFRSARWIAGKSEQTLMWSPLVYAQARSIIHVDIEYEK